MDKERCECPSPYINIYGLRTLLNTVDKNRITRLQTNKIACCRPYYTTAVTTVPNLA